MNELVTFDCILLFIIINNNNNSSAQLENEEHD